MSQEPTPHVAPADCPQGYVHKSHTNRDHSGVKIMSSPTVKEEIRRLAERLPDDVTWEEIHYQIYVRQAVEAGLKDSREGRTVPIDEARRRFGLESK